MNIISTPQHHRNIGKNIRIARGEWTERSGQTVQWYICNWCYVWMGIDEVFGRTQKEWMEKKRKSSAYSSWSGWRAFRCSLLCGERGDGGDARESGGLDEFQWNARLFPWKELVRCGKLPHFNTRKRRDLKSFLYWPLLMHGWEVLLVLLECMEHRLPFIVILILVWSYLVCSSIHRWLFWMYFCVRLDFR